jgi:hypothetical protein
LNFWHSTYKNLHPSFNWNSEAAFVPQSLSREIITQIFRPSSKKSAFSTNGTTVTKNICQSYIDGSGNKLNGNSVLYCGDLTYKIAAYLNRILRSVIG